MVLKNNNGPNYSGSKISKRNEGQSSRYYTRSNNHKSKRESLQFNYHPDDFEMFVAASELNAVDDEDEDEEGSSSSSSDEEENSIKTP
jgi:hypothetical protein